MSKNQQRHKNAYRAGYLDAINRLRQLPRSDELDKVIAYLTNQQPKTIIGVGDTVQESIYDAIRQITKEDRGSLIAEFPLKRVD